MSVGSAPGPVRRAVQTIVVLVTVAGPCGAALVVHHCAQSNQWLTRHVPVLTGFAASLPRVYPADQMAPIVAALLVLSVATLMLLVLRGGGSSEPTAIVSSVWPTRPFDLLSGDRSSQSWWALSAVLGAGWLGLLIVFVQARRAIPGSPTVTIAWLGLLLVTVMVTTMVDRRFRFDRALLDRRSLVLVGVLICVIGAWQSSDLNSWRFSCIGDEWSLHAAAMRFISAGVLQPDHLFAPVTRGVYGVHAPIITTFQALVMGIAGTDNLGWRLSGVVCFVLTIAPFVVVAGHTLGRRGLLVALAAYCTSPLMYAEVHSGYGWGQLNLWLLCTLAALIAVVERRTMRHAALLGAACAATVLITGPAVFVAPLAVATLAVALWWTTSPREPRLGLRLSPERAWAVGLVAVAGLVVTLGALLPRWLTPVDGATVDVLRTTLWKTNLGPLVAHYLGADWFRPPICYVETPLEFAWTITIATVRTVLAPITYRSHGLYLVGPIFDPVAGGLIAVGLVTSLGSRLARRRSALMWLFFIPALVLAGSLSPLHEYGDLRVTRLYFLVPFWAVFAGFGADTVVATVRRRLGSVSGRGLLALMIAVIVGWNLWAILVRSPREEPRSPASLAMQVLHESPPNTTVMACLEGWHPLEYAAAQYRGGDRLRFVTGDDFEQLLLSGLERDELALFALDRGDRLRTEKIAAFLNRRSDQLACRPLPSASRPQILVCQDAAAAGGRDSGTVDGHAAATHWVRPGTGTGT